MSDVVLHPYSTNWPTVFDSVRAELATVFAPSLMRIEHIGSTAVPGLCAKPVIDVALGASTLNEYETHIDALQALGYAYINKYEHLIPLRRYFVHPSVQGLRVHVHGLLLDGELWQQHLFFRDQLRQDAELRLAYQQLKTDLAHKHRHEKDLYTDAKAPFIRAVLAKMN